jgi:hypothetical protein
MGNALELDFCKYSLFTNERMQNIVVPRLDLNKIKTSVSIAILNKNRTGVAGAPPPSLVLGNFCWLIK